MKFDIEHPDRPDGEAGERAEGVADDERNRRDRLDVREGGERVAAEGRDPAITAITATSRAEGRRRS